MTRDVRLMVCKMEPILTTICRRKILDILRIRTFRTHQASSSSSWDILEYGSSRLRGSRYGRVAQLRSLICFVVVDHRRIDHHVRLPRINPNPELACPYPAHDSCPTPKVKSLMDRWNVLVFQLHSIQQPDAHHIDSILQRLKFSQGDASRILETG